MAAAILLGGCQLFTQANSSQADSGSVCLVLASSPKTITASDSTAYTIASYTVSGEGPSSSFAAEAASGSSYAKSGLATGSWTLTVNGLNSLGHVIAQATTTLTIASGQTTSAALTLGRISGSGTIDVTVTWSAAGAYSSIVGSLTGSSGASEAISISCPSSATQEEYTATKAAGDYVLVLKLMSGASVLDTITEAVQVYDGYTSSATYDRSPSSTSSTTTSSAGTATYSYASSSPVYAVDFGSNSSLALTVKGASGKSVYLVKENSSGSTSTSGVGAVASTNALVPYSTSLAAAPKAYTAAPDRPLPRGNEKVEAFNANPPPQPAASARAISRSASTGYGAAASGLTVNSSTKSFWVQTASGAWSSRTATLRAIGRYCYIWVDNGYFDNSSASTTDGTITSAQAVALQTKFDGSASASPAYSDGIFLNDTTIFGYEYGGGSGGDGGVDGDQHISILVYDIDFDKTQTSGVLGYFWAKDEYAQSTLDKYYGAGTYESNVCEMFYIDSYFYDKYPNEIYSTLAHEYQHMIQFNVKTVAHNVSSPTWYNEMCSMVAEDLVDANIGVDSSKYGPISRLSEYCYHYAESGVTDWLSSSSSDIDGVYKSYASAFAFGAYLERNYGGAKLFHAISANAYVGTDAITQALSDCGYGDDFAAAFKHYGESLVFTDIPAGSGAKSLKQASAAALTTADSASISYTAASIDYSTIQQYLLPYTSTSSYGYVSGAYGPRVYAPSTAVGLRPYGCSVHSSSAWQSLSGDLSMSLSAPSDSSVKFYIIVK
jgi:Peptidase M30.